MDIVIGANDAAPPAELRDQAADDQDFVRRHGAAAWRNRSCIHAPLHQAAPAPPEALGESIADQTERGTAEDDGERRHCRDPPGLAHIILALGDHCAPFGLWWRYAEAKETQP